MTKHIETALQDMLDKHRKKDIELCALIDDYPWLYHGKLLINEVDKLEKILSHYHKGEGDNETKFHKDFVRQSLRKVVKRIRKHKFGYMPEEKRMIIMSLKLECCWAVESQFTDCIYSQVLQDEINIDPQGLLFREPRLKARKAR